MNAQTRLLRPSARTLIAIPCIVLSGVASLIAFADPPAQTPHTLESKVSLSDLDLATPEGVRVAHKRLKRKAEFLCRQLWDDDSAAFRWTYEACVRETLANAIQRLNVPALVAADRPRAEP